VSSVFQDRRRLLQTTSTSLLTRGNRNMNAETRTERRLTAILCADVVGYTRMMAADESATLATLRAVRAELTDPQIAAHGGRIVKVMGDGVLVEFPSAVDAVQCGLRIQCAMAERGGAMRFRIGVNVGDVVIQDGDIFGDGVNLAARVESVGEPGGLALSDSAYEHVRGRVQATFRDDGLHELKNIGRPIRIWRWLPDGVAPAPAPALVAQPLPDKPSIVVLPFDNMSRDPDQEYFADGVVEAITAELSRVRSFFVIARNSAFAYKGRPKNVRDIGRELGVAYVLEGSVQRAGDRVRITVQLVETEAGAHVWAEKYDGALDDIFDLQDRITMQIAGALQPSIRLAEVERVRRKRPQDLGAYDYAMRAIRHVWTLDKDDAGIALDLLERGLAIDPDYPLALALAAWCWAQRSVYNWVEDIDAAMAQAMARAEKAANLSSDDPLILTVLGAVHGFARNYGAARVMLERAVSLDPNAAWAWSRLGWLETYTDHPEAARPHFEKAIRLSPLDPMNFNNYVGLAAVHQVAGDDEAAANCFLRALQERPTAVWIHRTLAPSLLAAGREREALASRDALLAAYPDFTVKKFRHAMVFSPRVLDRVGALLAQLGIPEE
jgi:adenylate cyclase